VALKWKHLEIKAMDRTIMPKNWAEWRKMNDVVDHKYGLKLPLPFL